MLASAHADRGTVVRRLAAWLLSAALVVPALAATPAGAGRRAHPPAGHDLQHRVRRDRDRLRQDRGRRSTRPTPTWSGFEESYGRLPRLARALGLGLPGRRAPTWSRASPCSTLPARTAATCSCSSRRAPSSRWRTSSPVGAVRTAPHPRRRTRRQVAPHRAAGARAGDPPIAHRPGARRRGGIPTFLVGDFNAPSRTTGRRRWWVSGPRSGSPMRWPVSRLLERARLRRLLPRGLPRSRRPPGPHVAGGPAPESATAGTRDATPPRTGSTTCTRRGPVDRRSTARSWGSGVSPGVDVGVRPVGLGSPGGRVHLRRDARCPRPSSSRPGAALVDVGADLTVTYHAPGNPGERVVVVPRAATRRPTPSPAGPRPAALRSTGR